MRKLIRRHVDRMLASAVAAVINLHILHQQRSGVSVGAENSVRRTIMHNTVAQRDVVRMMINSSKAAARYIEALEDVVIGEAKLHRVSAAGDNGPQSVYADACDSDLVYVGARPSKYQITGIGCITIDLNYVTRIEYWRDILQLLECPGWTNLVGDGIR